MFNHTTVLLRETIEAVVHQPAGVYVDLTLGGGGHAAAVLERLTSTGRLIGIDRDADALVAAEKRLADSFGRVRLVRGNYRDLPKILADLGISKVDGIIADLGVSSYQLDTAERGFSYQHDGRLDMRMDQSQTLDAYEIVNHYPERKLSGLIKKYGEERWASRIAAFITTARQEKTLETTAELVDVIKRAIPASARREGPHPAKRTFQALRIEVNGELRDLEESIRNAIDMLAGGGRIGIITFHSLEDRVVKQVFKELARDCLCPPGLPVCMCNHRATIRRLGKAMRPSPAELERNPRARSATLRVAEKLDG